MQRRECFDKRTDIAGRSSNHTTGRESIHIFTHVNADHVLLLTIVGFCQCLAQFRLSIKCNANVEPCLLRFVGTLQRTNR
jgi:hypothetical protein